MIGEQVIELQESVTMLFSDIRGFTQMATNLAPQDLCTLLNSLYSSFDEHLDVRGVYKIDTIGDAFVVVGGLAIENSTVEHASAIADFALDMLGEIENVKAMWQLIPEANPLIQDVTMRIGVHSGGVIAATVGLIRPKYLLFGRNTLIANAMESQGVPGQIQLSQSTYDLLTPGHTHFMDPRGEIDLGTTLGSMHTYFLKGRFSDLLRAARGRGRMQEEDAKAAADAQMEAQKQRVEDREDEDVEERHAEMLSVGESTGLLAPTDDTDAHLADVIPRAIRSVQTASTTSRDDLSLGFSSQNTRASRALAKQIEFVRGGGRAPEWTGKGRGGKRSGAPNSRSGLMKTQEQSLDRRMISLTLTTGDGAPMPLVPVDVSVPSSGTGSSLHSTPGGSRPITPRSASVVASTVPSFGQLPAAAGRTPHRRSFTLQNLNTNSLQLPIAPRAGLISPPSGGLPPISPQISAATLSSVHSLPPQASQPYSTPFNREFDRNKPEDRN